MGHRDSEGWPWGSGCDGLGRVEPVVSGWATVDWASCPGGPEGIFSMESSHWPLLAWSSHPSLLLPGLGRGQAGPIVLGGGRHKKTSLGPALPERSVHLVGVTLLLVKGKEWVTRRWHVLGVGHC